MEGTCTVVTQETVVTDDKAQYSDLGSAQQRMADCAIVGSIISKSKVTIDIKNRAYRALGRIKDHLDPEYLVPKHNKFVRI